MTESPIERGLIVFFRLTIGWTFLYAGIHHFGDWGFVGGFLGKTKTFHDIYAPLTTPAILPTLTFLVEYGHLLIGLSLISGLLVRVSVAVTPFCGRFRVMVSLLLTRSTFSSPTARCTGPSILAASQPARTSSDGSSLRPDTSAEVIGSCGS